MEVPDIVLEIEESGWVHKSTFVCVHIFDYSVCVCERVIGKFRQA